MKTAQLTLKEAIKQTVKFFTDNGGEFSKFTITSIIRGDVNNLKYELSDVAGTNLWHHEVRETFEQLLNDSELQIRFNRDHYDETHKTTYQVYVGADIPVITAVQKPSPNNPFTRVVTPNSNPFAGLKTNPTKVSGSSTTDNLLRVRNYLRNKGTASLKSIQSRLKQKGVTCKAILKDINSQSDLVVTPSENLSEYKVTFK
jgi:hypothetical protein